jgi:predicted transcriptional regulator
MNQFYIMLLGDLEKMVLQYLWEFGSADAKEVHAHFEKLRGGSLNTIQSTLDRLFKKGILAREKIGHAFHYRSAVDRNQFIGQLIKDITDDYSGGGKSPLLAAFASMSTSLDDEQLDELERLIEQRRAGTQAAEKS